MLSNKKNAPPMTAAKTTASPRPATRQLTLGIASFMALVVAPVDAAPETG